MSGRSHHNCVLCPKTSPMRRANSRRWETGLNPATRTAPPLGTRIPVSILIVVDFPAPFGPIRPIISPRSIRNESSYTAFTTRTSGYTTLINPPTIPDLLLAIRNTLLRPEASIMGSTGTTSSHSIDSPIFEQHKNPAPAHREGVLVPFFCSLSAFNWAQRCPGTISQKQSAGQSFFRLTPRTLIMPHSISPYPQRHPTKGQRDQWRQQHHSR